MTKKLPIRLTTVALLITFGYLGFNQFNKATIDSTEKKREDFNRFLDKHPYNNRSLSLKELEQLPKYDRPDLAAEQDYFMMVDPNTLTVPYERVVTAFAETTKRLNARKQALNGGQNKSNPTPNVTFYAPVNKTNKDAITVGGNPVIWEERGPDNVGGRTRALMWDPNDTTNRRVFAGGVSGGIWVNDNILDANSAWRAIDDFMANLAISCITFDPNNPMVMYAGTGEGWFNADNQRGVGIFKSEDGGNTWALMSSTTTPEFAHVQKINITNSGTILVATRGTTSFGDVSGGIFRSTNNGDSFTEVLNGNGADIEIAANGDIYASRGIFSDGSIFKSTNDGLDWTDVTPTGGSPQRIELDTSPSANVVYAISQNSSTDGIGWFQKSEDGGANWTNLAVPTHNDLCNTTESNIANTQAWYNLILAVSPTNPDVVIAGGVDLARTEDGGQTWTQISEWSDCSDIEDVHADQHQIVFRPDNPNDAIIGNDGGVYYSTSLGNSFFPNFESRDNNYTTSQFYSVATDNVSGSDYYIGGLQDNGTQQLRADLNSSSVEVVDGDGAFAHVDQLDRTFQLASIQFGSVRHSSNGGASFRGLSTTGGSNFINQSDYDNTSGILYSTGGNNEIKRIFNVKSSNPDAETIVTLDLGGRQTSALRANTNTANRIFVGTEGGRIYRIDNANADTPVATEITKNITTIGNVSSIDVGSTDDELIVTYSNFGVPSVWYTTDGGTTWVNKDEASHGLPDIPVRWVLFNPNNTQQVLLATELGMWSTNDITATNPEWEPSNEGLANTRCTMIQYRESDDMVVVSTHGRGLFVSNIFSMDDIVGPSVIALTPADEDSDVMPLDTNLVIEFNEPVKIGTGNITIQLASDDSVIETIDVTSDQVNVSGTRAIINPANDFVASTAYYVRVDEITFLDNFDNAFAGINNNTSWNFTTFNGDEPPMVQTLIENFILNESAPTESVDLDVVFNDIDNDDTLMTFEVISNSNPAIVLTNISGDNLFLSFPPNKIGSSEITVRATSNGKSVDDTFIVLLNSVDVPIFEQNSRSDSGWPEGTYTNGFAQNVDDFTVPGGQNWEIRTVTTQGFTLGDASLDLQNVSVTIFRDNAGAPGDVLQTQTIANDNGQIIEGTQTAPSFTVRLNSVITLDPDNYWLSVHPTYNTKFATDATGAAYFWFTGLNAGNHHNRFGTTDDFISRTSELIFSVDGVVSPMLSVDEFNGQAFSLITNPTNGIFEIQIDNALNSPVNVEVVDLSGRRIKSQSFNNLSQKRFSVDLTNNSSGIYIMKVINETKSETFKLIKE